MILKGMLKWAVGKDDRPINSTKSLKKRRKVHKIDMQRGDTSVGLISGCGKHRNNPQGQSKLLHKNRHRVVGVINNFHNDPDNIPPCMDQSIKYKDQQEYVPFSETPHNNNNNNNIINSDSKSLLYMSLDHLPMAIVKQYERMLQDAPLKPAPQSILKPQRSSNCNNNNNSRPSNIRIKNSKDLVSSSSKTTHHNSKSVTLQADGIESRKLTTHTKIPNNNPITSPKTNVKPCSSFNTNSPKINIKEAHNRPLKVLSSSTIIAKRQCDRQNKSPSPEAFNEKYPHNVVYPSTNNSTQVPEKNQPREHENISSDTPTCDPPLYDDIDSFNCTNTTSSSLKTINLQRPTEKSTINETSSVQVENQENDPHHNNNNIIIICQKNPDADLPSDLPPTVKTETPLVTRNNGKVNPHDTTDPQFLEKSITYSTPPISKCAKKLTLKRSELKKLERLKTQTERLNRFLKKYYHDCLPNLPEEEEEQCSPEEKSVCLSILRKHWHEVKSTTQSQEFINGYIETNIDHQKTRRKYPKYYNEVNRHLYSKENNKFSPLLSSSFNKNPSEEEEDDPAVRWQNLRNATAALISYSNDVALLPIIQEDSAEVSSSNNSEYYNQPQTEVARRESRINNIFGVDESFLMSSTAINADDSVVQFTKEHLCLSDGGRESVNTNLRISYDDGDDGGTEEEDGFGMKKLKGLMLEPLGDFFDPPASLAEDEGFMSPYPPEAYSPASSISTFNRFSVSSSGKGSGSTEEEEEHENEENLQNDDQEDDYDKDEISNLRHTQQSQCSSESSSSEADQVTSEEGGPKYIIMKMKHENANYLLTEENSNNETWNSHGYLPISPCGTISLNSHHHSDSSSGSCSIPPPENHEFWLENKHVTDDQDEESFIGNGFATAFSTPKAKFLSSLKSYRMKLKKLTPKKLVRKPPVNSAFSGKGEVLIRTYKNGDYVTVHVVQARRLQQHSRSSWKLCIKVSLLPEAETTLTKSSESILVGRNKSWVKIDQKFSFEIPTTESEGKVFLTFVKRLEKRTFFLGWATLDLSTEENTQCWLKLRKRKMSAATYPSQSSSNHCHSNFMLPGVIAPPGERPAINIRHGGISMDSPSPLPGHVEGGSSSSGCDCEIEPKSQLQNSSTMDSGVEDCCEPPPPPVPSIDLDDKVGQRVNVKLLKQEGSGFGFSVVWVSPPRIERLEKGKTADVAGLRIGDLIIGVNGVDVTIVPNTTIYTKMKSTGNELEMEVWRKHPQAQPRTSLQASSSNEIGTPSTKSSCTITGTESSTTTTMIPNVTEGRQNRETQQSQCAACLPQTIKNSSTSTNKPAPVTNRIQPQTPPISILKPPPPAPPTVVNRNPPQSQQQQPSAGSSSWRIRFNIELLDNEDDCLKQFFICELKFFRKIVAALDRYLIPAQANRLLTPQEINLIFSNVIKIITVTKRILNCVANGSSSAEWKLGSILLSTHSDHLSEVVSAYSAYAKTLCYSAMILSEKMSLQEFAKFVLETPVPKGHLDLTSLLFAPFEHLRNICEICEEISHNNEEWLDLSMHLKECYADIVCETDFMEPISHVSMKKNPLLSVRDLEKRIVSTTCQPLKVCEKGRKWLFGSRLFKKESDGSWTPVWAFLFSDIIVLTSHTTRDRVFFVKEPSIRLEDVVTLHFNLPRKHENEFRLLFGPEPVHQSRFDKILPIHRNKKSNQIILRTSNVQLKSVWKLLLQRQIITLNTKLSKSASSNFSISEFCERFPLTPQDDDEKDIKLHRTSKDGKANNKLQAGSSKGPGVCLPQNTIFDRQHYSEERNLSVIKEEKTYSQSVHKTQKPYAPDGLSSITKELLKSRVTRISPDRRNRVEVIHEEIKVTPKPTNDPTNIIPNQSVTQNSQSTTQSVKNNNLKTFKIDEVVNKSTTADASNNKLLTDSNKNLHKVVLGSDVSDHPVPVRIVPRATTTGAQQQENPISSLLNNNNNELCDFNLRNKDGNKDKCPCEELPEQNNKLAACETEQPDVSKSQSTSKGSSNSKDAFLNEKIFYENSPRKYQAVSKQQVADKKQAIIVSKESNAPDFKDCNNKNSHTITALVEDGELSQKERTLAGVSRPGEQNVLIKEKFQRNNTPSPSMSNHRVEALKNEGVGMPKPKPGSRIMTNATLKSRQQEILAHRIGETTITMVDKTDNTFAMTSNGNNASTGTDCILISQHVETIPVVGHKDASSSPILSPPRCQSENSHVKAKSIHTDSPIISGFGSDRSRRRILYDYKIQRDYPELFGITPKDRRTFIKRLAEKQPENDKSFIAPYYFSPLPTPKFAQRLKDEQKPIIVDVMKKKDESSESANYNKVETKKVVAPATAAEKQQIDNNKVNVCIMKKVSDTACSSKLLLLKNDNEESMGDFAGESDEIDNRAVDDDINLKEVVRGILRGHLDDDDDDTDEDSDDDDGSEGHEARPEVHRHRSPEESSNDSGISDELTNEKSKLTNGFAGENERFQCNMAVNSSEVNTVKFSPKLDNTILTHCDKMPKKAHACNTTPKQYNKIDDVYFVEGQEEASMEEMVVLKADKSTGTDDDYFNSCSFAWSNNRPEKSMRILMAERREAFFASYQQSASSFITSSSGPSSFKSVAANDPPLIVKIVDGGTRHSTIPEFKPILKSPPSERVQLTRLPEKERTAKVERVESSDDSTSSSLDLASASPALENGTTDPSWSSSSSSLAGYASSKEEASTSAGASSTAYTNNNNSSSLVNNSTSLPSTSSRNNVIKMSDFSNGLPTSSSNICNFPDGTLIVNSNNCGPKGPEIIVTQESPETPTVKNGYSSDGEEEDSVLCNGKKDSNNSESDSEKKSFLRVESNESTVENYGDDDDYNFDDEDDLSQCSVATINRYGTFESLEKIESDDNVGGLPDFSRPMTRSKARFTFEDEDSDDDNDLFEEDFESDFNFRFPSQIQDNTYSVSRLGPLPPLLEEDFEDDIFDEQRMNGASPSCSSEAHSSSSNTLRSRHETGLRNDNSFLLARLATMYARSSISPLKILRELWLKKRYRQNWAYKE